MDDILFGTPLGRPWPDVLLLGIHKYAQFALPWVRRFISPPMDGLQAPRQHLFTDHLDRADRLSGGSAYETTRMN
jgi:hypothetical protein